MNQKHLSSWKTIGVAGLALLAVVALFITAGGPPLAAQTPIVPGEQPVPSVSVSGFGQAFGAPDVAHIEMGVDIVNNDVGGAVTEANEVMDRIIAAISETGVAEEDIRTTGFNVWSDFFDPVTGEQTRERVYHVQNIVRVTVRDVSQVAQVIDAGLNAGANSVFGLNFGIDNPTELEQEARLEAIENARDRAQKLADAMGVTLGDPIIVTETFGGPIQPFAFDAAQAGLGGGGAPPISGGQLSVSVQVNVTFAIAQ
jgi:uncharacterized protein YggE